MKTSFLLTRLSGKPMKTSIIKMAWRSIKNSMGRYMALLSIVALSAGFFAGLKLTKNAMVNTADIYLSDHHFYDFRLISTLGITEEDVKEFAKLDEILNAEGTYSVDAIIEYKDADKEFKIMSIPELVNQISLVEGRMPENKKECLVDADKYTKEDIGTTVKLANSNGEDITSKLSYTEYTIVGLAESPMHIGIDRGTTTVGSGALNGFIYVNEDVFELDVYTELNMTLTDAEYIYSDEYQSLIDNKIDDIEKLLEDRADKRYQDLLKENGITDEMAAMLGTTKEALAEQYGLVEAETYVLTRNENTGYTSFENDTGIVSGIANIFPVFFIMIAMLVCMTTMTRMVDEERTQIGVLKAMGFSNGKIVAKYLLYAGSATVIGWTIGYFVCTWGIPQIFWFAYNSMYNFAPLSYLFSPVMAAITLCVSLIGILGSTYLSCRKELFSEPAKLIRPRAAKNGKRVLIERVTFVWKRLTFLQKITLRNMFRYKRKLILMIVGISCCTGLLVTAFGVADSMFDVADRHYDGIQKYELEASFAPETRDDVIEGLDSIKEVEKYIFCSSQFVDVIGEKDRFSSVNMICVDDTTKLSDFWNLHDDNGVLTYPQKGEMIISAKLADKLSILVGDVIEVQDADMHTAKIKVTGIFENYLNSYIFISPETYEDTFGEWAEKTALITIDGDVDEVAKKVNDVEAIASVQQLEVMRDLVNNALSCLDYIVLMVVVFSAALAFIVIYNLTNINLAERSREIATVQVLGFRKNETESYVLTENIGLSILAGFVGLPLGVVFHRIVMSMIQIDLIMFRVEIKPISYVYALILTVVFATIVNLFMRKHIAKIKMAESLKAVE